jgi:hypothetical protein
MRYVRNYVFVGSSMNALRQSDHIVRILRRAPGMHVLHWREAFLPNRFVFEVIENIALKVTAAVFVASPDDPAQVTEITPRGRHLTRDVFLPRTNVLLEWAYLTARLGRDRVALCQFEEVEPPSDTRGLVYIPLGRFRPDSKTLPPYARQRLLRWAKNLPLLCDDEPATKLIHGYSGLWQVFCRFSKWRGLTVHKGEHACFKGNTALEIGGDGRGRGVTWGTMHIKVRGCSAAFRVVHQESKVVVRHNGILEMEGQPVARQREGAIVGRPPQSDGFVDDLTPLNEYRIILSPSDRQLSGTYWALRVNKRTSIGDMKFTRP